MAHANPEFALGLMRRESAPVSTQLDGPPSLGSLRARMIEIGELIRIGYPVDACERDAFALWERTVRQQRTQFARERRIRDALSEPAGGMHAGGKIGERFVEPRRRVPLDVQRGKVPGSW